MGAFGDAFAAVEDRFLTALFDAALVSDDTWNQVQRLDVAVQETGVLHRDQAESLIKWNQVARNSKNHQIWFYGSRWKLMSTIGSSAGTLPVQHTVVNLIGIDAFLQLGTQFFARHFKRDFQQLAAVVETVEVVVCGKNVVVCKGGGIVAAISKINGAVQHRDFHFLEGADFSIVISDIFHCIYFLSMLIRKYLVKCLHYTTSVYKMKSPTGGCVLIITYLFVFMFNNLISAYQQRRQQVEEDKSVRQVRIALLDQGDNADAG